MIWINVGIFAIATLAFWYLPTVSTTDNADENRWKNLISGWQEIRKQPIIFTIVSMDILESIANTAWISAVVLVFVKDVLHVSENWWGYINATYFLGAALGSMLVFYLNVMVDKNKSKVIVISSILGGVITLLVALGGNPLLILVYSILIGIFLQVKNIPQATILQQKVDRNKLTSVYAATGILNTATFSLSSLLMGAVADTLGVNIVFVFSGILLFVVAFIARNKRKLLDE
ncbi:MFS transporter [Enterococcus termitis]